jgi:hypothetical protein
MSLPSFASRFSSASRDWEVLSDLGGSHDGGTSILPTRLQSTLETFSFSARGLITIHKPTVESYGPAAHLPRHALVHGRRHPPPLLEKSARISAMPPITIRKATLKGSWLAQ